MTVDAPGPSGRARREFGDFQTPRELADDVCRFLASLGVAPATVVEPTCGLGHFVLAALDRFPGADCLGFEVHPAYVDALATSLASRADGRGRVVQANFFDLDWGSTLDALPGPILVLGNPPWVTNAEIGSLGGTNLPPKANGRGLPGIDALTGKSNFDISEWMLNGLLKALAGRNAWLAMLCKTAVARKVLRHAWKDGISIDRAELRTIDAASWFGAAVDASLLICKFSPAGACTSCGVFPGLDAEAPRRVFESRDGLLIADASAYARWKHLAGRCPLRWRSGIKHDAAKVVELRREGSGYRNGLGESVELEADFLFPMLKSSEVAGGAADAITRWMLVPQRAVDDDTEAIGSIAPKTWYYLRDHRETFDRRASAIYRNRPPFSIFGVGDYTFSPWKVAISGFYKRLNFVAVGPQDGKPVVFDDTVYFTACRTEAEAKSLASMLNSEVAREFFGAFIFWDAKRPITTEVLHRLDLRVLAEELGLEAKWMESPDPASPPSLTSTRQQAD